LLGVGLQRERLIANLLNLIDPMRLGERYFAGRPVLIAALRRA
jgi:hypothetical protein